MTSAGLFLGTDDASRDWLVEATARLVAEVVHRSGALAGAWNAEVSAGAIEQLDPLPRQAVPFDDVIAEVGEVVLAHAIRPTDRRTVAHLHSPTLITAAATEVAIGATNQSMDSYDQAPAATLVEDRLVRRLAEVIGLPATGSGVMTAGGTASNLMGLTLAREAAARRRGFDVAADGLPPEARQWRVIASATAHFSITRAAMLAGLGHRSVVTVDCDDTGAMDIAALDATLADLRADGFEVFAIVGTAGTTDLGAIDPLDQLADRAAEVGAWFHVDAAVGGALALSDRLAPLLDGIGRASSVTVDLHKLWWQPISSSVLLVSDVASFGLIHEHSEYLDRVEDAETGVLNLVGRSLDTSRRFDALKALVSLRSTGTDRLAAMLEHLVDTTAAVAGRIAGRPGFELLAPPTTVMVVFRWTGRSLDDEPLHDAALDDAALDRINTAVQRWLFESGQAVVGRTRHRGVVALKFTLVNPGLEVDDLDVLLDLIATTAAQLLETP